MSCFIWLTIDYRCGVIGIMPGLHLSEDWSMFPNLFCCLMSDPQMALVILDWHRLAKNVLFGIKPIMKIGFSN
jgi:hypothetical protein